MQDDVEIEEPKDLLINRVKAALKKKTMTVMRRQLSQKMKEEQQENQDKIDKKAAVLEK